MPHIRIATANLNNCGEWSHDKKITHFADAVVTRLHLPHLIALQEIGGIATDSNIPVEAQVKDRIIEAIYQLSKARYRYLEIPPLPGTTGGNIDANIRSAFLLLENTPNIDQTEGSKTPIHIKDLRILGEEHPAFIGDMEHNIQPSRKPLLLHLEFAGHEIIFINCHLKSKNSHSRDAERLAKQQRNQQAELIQKEAAKLMLSPEISLVILGDMNDTPNSDTLKILQSIGLNSNWTQYKGRIYTLKHRNRPIVLDYILYSSHLELIQQEVIHINTYLGNNNRFSDHDPVVCEFRWR